MRRLVLSVAAGTLLAGVVVVIVGTDRYLVSLPVLVGCEERYEAACMAAKRHQCAYEPGCVSVALVQCQQRAATRCAAWRRGER